MTFWEFLPGPNAHSTKINPFSTGSDWMMIQNNFLGSIIYIYYIFLYACAKIRRDLLSHVSHSLRRSSHTHPNSSKLTNLKLWRKDTLAQDSALGSAPGTSLQDFLGWKKKHKDSKGTCKAPCAFKAISLLGTLKPPPPMESK